MKQATLILFFIIFIFDISYGQQTVIKGRVIDAMSGDGMPFVSIYFKNTTIGTSSDFDGYYTLKSDTPKDSILATYVGYSKKAKYVQAGIAQIINFQLSPESVALNEIVITPGENFAWAIMRNVIKNKDKNNKNSLSALEYESYNKVEIDVDNISENLKKKRLYRKISQVLDSIERVAGEDGKPILPIFISETISDVYIRQRPDKKREKIIKTKLTGVGVQDGTLVSQLVGSTLQEYNFYNNFLNIVSKDFVSPIADGWKSYYDYTMLDSVYIGDYYCYKIDVKPKRAQDLAFFGTIWITQKEWALKQIDVSITQSANVNFVKRIKIQQELEPTEKGPWLPVKSRVMMDLDEPGKNWMGMIAKFYTSNKNIIVNKNYDLKFYETPIEIAEDARIQSKDYWSTHRHDSLSQTEKNVYVMIDSLRNIPAVKSYIDIANIVVNGYKRVDFIDIGPYVFTYAKNNIEGHRFRLGFKTNIDFSNKWIFRGYGAYGTLDKRFKYSGSIEHILSRKRWTIGGIKHTYDIERVGLMTDDIYDNTLFYTSSKWGTMRRPFLLLENSGYFFTQLSKDLSQKVTVRARDYRPLFAFEYYKDIENDTLSRGNTFKTTEIVLDTRFAKNELFLQNDNERISLGTDNWPIVSFRYILGIKDVAGSDFAYHKFNASIAHSINLGYLGRSSYIFNIGYIPSKIPYQLLDTHLGNESLFFNIQSFNLMNFFEFVSDSYSSLQYIHRFEGLFFNRIPLVKKLKWRFFVTGNALYGSIRQENIDLIPEKDLNGHTIDKFGHLKKEIPYLELGYGIENIFKFLRIDAIHRMNYLDNPRSRKFGVKISAQFRL